jgi:hypothetical protein
MKEIGRRSVEEFLVVLGHMTDPMTGSRTGSQSGMRDEDETTIGLVGLLRPEEMITVEVGTEGFTETASPVPLIAVGHGHHLDSIDPAPRGIAAGAQARSDAPRQTAVLTYLGGMELMFRMSSCYYYKRFRGTLFGGSSGRFKTGDSEPMSCFSALGFHAKP